MLLIGCGLFSSKEESWEGEAGALAAVSETPTGTLTPPVVSETAPGIGGPTMVAPVGYDGPTSLEERILAAPVIARVRLDSTTSAVESATAFDGSTKYIALLEFSFSVQEYLKGSGVDDIVAVWESRPIYDARQEAEAALPAIAAARDTRWDDREAIVFLKSSQTYLTSTQETDRYYLTWQHEIDFDDKYSIASRHDKLWLPAAAAVGATSQPTGDQQRFLTDVPPATGTAPTITLGEIKTRIATVTAKLDAGDGSEEYTECVRETYYLERKDRHLREIYPDRGSTGSNISPPHTHQFNSGLGVGTVVYEIPEGDPITPSVPFEVWLDGGDASLFSVANLSQDYRVTTTRPLPGMEYDFHFNHRGPYFSRCDGNTTRYEWTVTVTAPDGTLHEAFFDPVTDGSAVAADGANGVLKPASFADSNGATSTVQRIAWEPGTGASGTVKLKLSPHTGIAGHAVDFIALDGSVSLSLNVADAAVDLASNTLSWPVVSQPWQNGDELMVRIREAPDCSTGAVTDTSANPGLARDCEALLVVMDTLRGTATLNWNATTTITAWDGVTVSGTPSRVTRLELANEGLDGSIPEYLGRLLGLTHLDLSRNSLTGHIPAELGGLSNLEALRLSGNSLTGCIPMALMSVATNDLSSLDLLYCRPPAPENLTAGTPSENNIPLSWDPVANAGTYRIEYSLSTSTEWFVDVDNATTTRHVVDNLTCGTDFQFRMSALGSGTVYAPEWSEASDVLTAATAACPRSP